MRIDFINVITDFRAVGKKGLETAWEYIVTDIITHWVMKYSISF